ncbi:MAG TPA: type III pantothenate kinase [Candidatus Limnocylindrales bacterium]|nr:type III pantothenate kinase [Candidatus Limnocylindrales bacterium]
MLLAVDIGNTNITLGIVEDGVIDAVRRAGTHRATTADELEVLLRDLLSLDEHALEGVTAMAIASVVPAVTALAEQVAARLGIPALVASAGIAPIAIRYDRPDLVGADRIVNALAALRLYGAPAVVCDLGTATTLDCVGADGAFVGGAIAAGLELGIAALSSGTAKLPRVELRTPDRVIARDTVAAIQAGSVLGYQALVAGLVARARAELAEAAGIAPDAVHTILTGGLSAAPWAQDIAGIDAIDPDLTLKGLTILHAEVAGGDPYREHRFEALEPFADLEPFPDEDLDAEADEPATSPELPR